MELRQYLQVIWNRLWLIGLGTLLAAIAGFAAGYLLFPANRASTSLLVSSMGLVGSDSSSVIANEHLASTYAELLVKRPIIEAAASKVGLDPDEAEQKVKVRLIPSTTVIELTVEDNDPHLAAEFANEIVEVFRQSTRESGGIRGRDLVVVEPAIIRPPLISNAVFYAFLGAFAGFVFSVGAVFLREFLDDSIKTSGDVKQILALPTLGTIPRLSRSEQVGRLVTLTHPGSPVSEAYRALRTNIRFARMGEPPKTLLVTSAESGTGKTTIAANLGVALAQAGFQTVLVDTNLRSPVLHHLFNAPNTAGLSDLLVGGVQNAQECMVETGVDNLWLIPGGPIPANPSELLESNRMEAVLDQVKGKADFVILDASAALMVTDTVALACRADGVILVVETRRTPQQAARQTCETLQRVGAQVLGAVLTRAPVRQTARRTLAAQHQRVPPSA